MIKNEHNVDSDADQNAKLEWQHQTSDEGRNARHQVRLLASPHRLDDANLDHEDDRSNDDAGEGGFRDVEEVRGEEEQRENHQNT